jgi:hypothetical protein
MPKPSAPSVGRARVVHRHAWLWEPLESEPTFLLRAMFGTKATYLGGKLMFCFCAREEPWRGVLVATEHAHHAALRAEFPDLAPHPVLPKWLYLAETADTFERTAARLITLARRRDPRLGVVPGAKQRKTRSARAAAPRP